MLEYLENRMKELNALTEAETNITERIILINRSIELSDAILFLQQSNLLITKIKLQLIK